MSADEDLVRAIALATARAECLASRGDLTNDEYTLVRTQLFYASRWEDVERLTSRLDEFPACLVAPLNVNATRNALLGVDYRLMWLYPENYAGFRFAADDTLVEFGFLTDLRERVVGVRQLVGFGTRVSGFSARFSVVDLLSTWVQVERADSELKQSGVPIKTLGVSIADNAVILGISRDVEQHGEGLRARFGPALKVVQAFGAG